MKSSIYTCIVSLALAACTIEQQGGELETEFHPPLTYAAWETQQLTGEQGQPVCAVTSGHNGLAVYVRRMQGDVSVSVKGNRKLPPSAFLTVNINGKRYQTSQEFFAAADALELAQDLAAGGKAYLEWSEIHPFGHGRRLHIVNVLKMEGFTSRFKECQRQMRA
jgi:hypothetical protein